MIRRLAPMLLLALAAPLCAEVVPTPGPGDPHIQTVAYDVQQVVALRIASGYALTVALSPDERIETVTVGDASGWQVQANRRADRLVIKPFGFPGPTNLTAITDQRVYNFTLYSAGAAEGALPYIVSFVYPAPATEPKSAQAAVIGRYRLSGSQAMRPVGISDDGTFTSIVWPADISLPAVYARDTSGKLALVNGVMREDTYVLEGVYERLVFMAGRARAAATRVDVKDAR